MVRLQCTHCRIGSQDFHLRTAGVLKITFTWYNSDMALLLRLEYPGAIYHITARGNARGRDNFQPDPGVSVERIVSRFLAIY